MAIAINSSFTASVPAAYGGSTPVIDLGLSPAAISTAVALTNAGSVVVSISGAPAGSVTYTAAGLLREISFAGVPAQRPTPQVVPQERQSSQAANSASADLPGIDGQQPDQSEPEGANNGGLRVLRLTRRHRDHLPRRPISDGAVRCEHGMHDKALGAS